MTGEIAVHMDTRLDLCAVRKGDAHPGVGAALKGVLRTRNRNIAAPESLGLTTEWALHRGTGYFPIGNKAGIGAGIFGIVAGGTLLCYSTSCSHKCLVLPGRPWLALSLHVACRGRDLGLPDLAIH